MADLRQRTLLRHLSATVPETLQMTSPSMPRLTASSGSWTMSYITRDDDHEQGDRNRLRSIS